MSGVRVLVGTRKGAFVLTADGKRDRWKVRGPHFPGWEIYHLKGSPAEPNRIYGSQTSGWFGQVMQRSDDGGETWETVGNEFAYDGVPGTHMWYDGTQHPWQFARVWHLEPSLTDPDTVYAGVEDAALFRSADGGRTWSELSGLRGHPSGPSWQPGAGGMCLHTVLLDPSNPKRIFAAISAAGAFRSDDGGTTWRPINQGLKSQGIPDPNAEVGHCVHRIAMHPSRPNVLYMQKHWDVMRSDDAGDSWHEVSGNLPTDFGFPIDVHAHEPETIYVVPITSDSHHFPPEGGKRVGGAHEGAAAAGLLRQRAARRDGGRPTRSLRHLLRDQRRAGLRLVRLGDHLDADRPGSAGGAVRRGPDPAMIRVVLPQHLRALARVGEEVQLQVEGPPTQRSVLDALEARYPMLRGTIRGHTTLQRRPFVRFFACEQDLSHEPADAPLPEPVASGAEPFMVVGAMAGG
jgi:photosystem II stability/assembly factor-like uncharacterized protein